MAKKEAPKSEVINNSGEPIAAATATKAPGEVPGVQSKALASASATVAAAIPAEDKTLAEQLLSLGASTGLVKRAVKAATNFGLMDTPKIPRIKALSDGLLLDENSTEDPLKEIEGVVMFGAKYKAFYAEEYDPEVKNPPDCFSHDGKVPEADVKARQNPICKGCPKNEFGTAKAGKGKACRDIRRLFILTSVAKGEESIMPLQLNVTPSSIKNWDDYLGRLTQNGISYDEVSTKVLAKKKNREDKYVTLNFVKIKSFGEDDPEEKQVLANISALRTLWKPYMERQHVDLEETIEDAEPPVTSAGAATTNRDF